MIKKHPRATIFPPTKKKYFTGQDEYNWRMKHTEAQKKKKA